MTARHHAGPAVGIISQQFQRGFHVPHFPAAAHRQHGKGQLLIICHRIQRQRVGKKRPVSFRCEPGGVLRHGLRLLFGKMPVGPLQPHQPPPVHHGRAGARHAAVGPHHGGTGIDPRAAKHGTGNPLRPRRRKADRQLRSQRVPHHRQLSGGQTVHQRQQQRQRLVRVIDLGGSAACPGQMGQQDMIPPAQLRQLVAEGVLHPRAVEQQYGGRVRRAKFFKVHNSPPFHQYTPLTRFGKGCTNPHPGAGCGWNRYCSAMTIFKSFSCWGSTISGAPDISSLAFCTLGKAMTSRMESFFSISITIRSRP